MGHAYRFILYMSKCDVDGAHANENDPLIN